MTAEALEKTCAKYNLKITHETMRIAVCDVLDEVQTSMSLKQIPINSFSRRKIMPPPPPPPPSDHGPARGGDECFGPARECPWSLTWRPAACCPLQRAGRRGDEVEPQNKSLRTKFISQKVFIKSFCKSQPPHKSVNLSCIITNVKKKLTGLCGD